MTETVAITKGGCIVGHTYHERLREYAHFSQHNGTILMYLNQTTLALGV